MKLHFEPNLDYQCAAIDSVCDLFRGQEICRTKTRQAILNGEEFKALWDRIKHKTT